MRLSIALAITLALAGGSAIAQPRTGTLAESVVELRLNGQPVASTLVVRRDTDGTLLLRAADLALLRLKPPARGAVLVDGERYYRIGADGGARVVFDEAALSVAIDLPASAFVATRSEFQTPDAAPRLTSDPGAFLNYDLSTAHAGNATSGGGVLELGVFGAQGIVTNSLIARAGRERAEAVRLDTTWTRDFPDRLATLRMGDSFTSTGDWGRSVRFGGIQFGTNFGMQPTLITTPLLAASGEAVVPSTVDIFVNGQQVASEDVPPGPFTIDRLPSVNGAGEMQVVVVDALGRQQVLTQPFYTGATLLRAGLNDFSVELGGIRRDYGRRSSNYGDLVGAVTFRRGISDQLTTELHAEAQAGGASAAGIDAALRIGALGIFTATAAGGGNDAGSGWLGAVGFEHDGARFNAFARTRYTTEHFAQLGDGALTERPRQRSFAGAGYDLQRLGSLQLVYGLQTRWDAPQTRTVGFSYSMELGALGFLNLFATYNDGADTQADVVLSWTMPLGERRTASSALRQVLSGDDAGQDFEATATLQQSLPVGPGFGYTMTVASTDDHHLGYAHQGRRGVASVEYARRAGEDGWRAGVVGGLAVTQAGAMLSRQLEQGFAMVQVADYAGLEVYLDNQPVGRTDDKGRVLLDRLRAYEENQISLDPASVPMDATLASPMMTVVPAYRSGVLVQFPVTRADALTLTLVQPDLVAVPAGAQVAVGESSFPVGISGRVQINGVGARATAIAEWRDGRCAFDLERPANGDPLPDLGTVICEPLSAGREQR